jgi:hypothetical protein
MLNGPVRIYLVPKGTQYNTPPPALNEWRPIHHTHRCLVFDDIDEADQCLVAVAQSKGRKAIEVAYTHKSFRCDLDRLLPSETARSGRTTAPRHIVPDLPAPGTLVAAVAWVREDVLLPNGQIGYKRSTPLTIPRVRLARYMKPYTPDVINRPQPAHPPVNVKRNRFYEPPYLVWSWMTEYSADQLASGSVLRLYALTHIG